MLKKRTIMTQVALLAGLTAMGQIADLQAKEMKSVFGYVLLAEKQPILMGNTVALARIVLEPKDDKDLSNDLCTKASLKGPHGKKPLTALVQRVNPNPDSFPIAVCEALIDFSDQYSAQGEEWQVEIGKDSHPVALPTVVKNPERAFLIGDSGCRDNKKGNSGQGCDDQEWPFAHSVPDDLAKMIEKDHKSTIIIHLGDYKYRGKKEKTSDGSPWKNWKKDFFSPVLDDHEKKDKKRQNLFAMAPWAVTRGNHELCAAFGDNGPGWFLLLDPHSTLLGDPQTNTCQQQNGQPVDVTTSPYRLDFANQFSLVMTDSASIQESGVNQDQATQLASVLTTVGNNFKQGKDPNRLAWWVTHKPIYSALGSKAAFSNDTEQAAVAMLPQKTPPANIQMMASGHKHLYQSVEVPQQPLQLVVGNSGVQINCKGYNGNTNKFNATISSSSAFGFAEALLTQQQSGVTGWNVNVYAYPWEKEWSKPELVQTCSYPVSGATGACKVLKPEFFPSSCSKEDDEEEKAEH